MFKNLVIKNKNDTYKVDKELKRCISEFKPFKPIKPEL